MINCGAKMPLWYFADVTTLSAALGVERGQDGIVFRQVCDLPAIRTQHCARRVRAVREDFHRVRHRAAK